jgi:hypothetical protein
MDNEILTKNGLPIIVGLIVTVFLGLIGHNTWGVVIGAIVMGYLTLDEMQDLGINSLIMGLLSTIIIDFGFGAYGGVGWFIWDIIFTIVLAFVFGWLGIKLRGFNGENTPTTKYIIPIAFGLIITILLGLIGHNTWGIIIGAIVMGYLTSEELGDLGLNSILTGLLAAIVIDFGLGAYGGFSWFIWDIIISIVLAFVFGWLGTKIKEYYY